MTTILVTGATGFIGSRLCEHLLSSDKEVIGLTRNISTAMKKQPKVAWVDSLAALEGQCINGIVNLAGHSLAKSRWTASTKQLIIDSRVGLTNKLFDFFSRQSQTPEWLINGSAIGYYGSHYNDKPLSETAVVNDSFSHQLCRQWEESALAFESLDVRVCLLRLGIVLGRNGGALASMLPPFKWGLGGPMGSGKQWMSWVHLTDVITIIDYCINQSVGGAVNVVAPGAVTNREFSTLLAAALGKPCFMKTPGFLLALLLGEMAEELLLSGQRVEPARLIKEGFSFSFNTLDSAFSDIFKGSL